jgi:hypothetical protein
MNRHCSTAAKAGAVPNMSASMTGAKSFKAVGPLPKTRLRSE